MLPIHGDSCLASGHCNNLQEPSMGSFGAHLGRNVPLALDFGHTSGAQDIYSPVCKTECVVEHLDRFLTQPLASPACRIPADWHSICLFAMTLSQPRL